MHWEIQCKGNASIWKKKKKLHKTSYKCHGSKEVNALGLVWEFDECVLEMMLCLKGEVKKKKKRRREWNSRSERQQEPRHNYKKYKTRRIKSLNTPCMFSSQVLRTCYFPIWNICSLERQICFSLISVSFLIKWDMAPLNLNSLSPYTALFLKAIIFTNLLLTKSHTRSWFKFLQ